MVVSVVSWLLRWGLLSHANVGSAEWLPDSCAMEKAQPSGCSELLRQLIEKQTAGLSVLVVSSWLINLTVLWIVCLIASSPLFVSLAPRAITLTILRQAWFLGSCNWLFFLWVCCSTSSLGNSLATNELLNKSGPGLGVWWRAGWGAPSVARTP